MQLKIDNDLLTQWEPKVHRMLRNWSIQANEYEDIAQELRFTTLKAADHFNPNLGVSFHTYLHTAMNNKIGTLIHKTKQWSIGVPIEDYQNILISDITEEIPFWELGLKGPEMMIVDFLMCGYNMSEIQRFGILPKELSRIKRSLKQKLVCLKNE